ncbi:MAG TPA: RluA family pseudouridine synthase [Candidatus Brocadiia bacterium]|nr:RluA family pseudouridine synthase [Planctomycetota bacterium]MDO8092928.1 RluA family pseudouridine synthase [Candidatus Brocadiales bacterium]
MIQDTIKTKEITFVVKKDYQRRVDKYLAARFTNFSRSAIQKWIKEGAVKVSGARFAGGPVKSSYEIRRDDVVTLEIPIIEAEKIEPENIPLDIIYEDDYLIVINKPPDMVVHPAGGHPSGTLVNALAYHCQNLSWINGPVRPGIVHRLDRDTSGVMIAIKSNLVHSKIARQFEDRKIEKEYIAVVEGEIELDSDLIKRPIGRHVRDRKLMAIRHDIGKSATTVYEVMERFRGYTLVKLMPETGRTHQIRVHMRSIGHPIVADFTYGGKDACYESELRGKEVKEDEEPIIERQALHAYRLKFFHPILNKTMDFKAELPPDVSNLIKKLREIRPLPD